MTQVIVIKKMKKFGLWIGLMGLTIIIFVGCGNQKERKAEEGLEVLLENTESLLDAAVVEDTIEALAEIENAVAEKDDFESIVQFSDKFEAFYNTVEEAGEDIEDFAFLGDMMMVSTLQMINSDAELDQALHLMADAWEDVKMDMPNGAGQYDSILTKEGDQYHYTYHAYWNTGKVTKTTLIYNPKEKTFDYSRESDDEADTNRYMQQYIDENGNFYVAYSEKNRSNGEGEEMIIFYDGTQAFYGRNVKVANYDDANRINIISDRPNAWETLAKDKTYSTLFIFDGTQVDYKNN
ncbi:MAG: hypothetical protein CVV00_00350 [Firmicutes bacterium HGW-Firmicutes-5]|nr:MAG: hypothetical protein CVV00_00350 [Firmicutes bacterium HGW-Firmicutes-5]